MTCPLGHTLPSFLPRLRKGRMRSTICRNTLHLSRGDTMSLSEGTPCCYGVPQCPFPQCPLRRLVEPELEHVDVALGRDGLGGDLRRLVGDEGAGHQEVVVAPAVLSVRLGHLPLPDLLPVDQDVADLLAQDG